jgi:hypothetical protein
VLLAEAILIEAVGHEFKKIAGFSHRAFSQESLHTPHPVVPHCAGLLFIQSYRLDVLFSITRCAIVKANSDCAGRCG